MTSYVLSPTTTQVFVSSDLTNIWQIYGCSKEEHVRKDVLMFPLVVFSLKRPMGEKNRNKIAVAKS